jgi:YHYH protein
MKKVPLSVVYAVCCVCGISAQSSAQVPLLNSWQTKYSARYARVVEQIGSSPVTTWPAAGLRNMGGGQSTPIYSDITQVSYSSGNPNGWVYVRGSGLASHQMGPWYSDGTLTQLFGNWPSDRNYIRRFPMVPTIPATKVTNGLGALGIWVNGVAVYNLLDGFSYSTATGRDGTGAGGNGVWVRNAQAVEVVTFDKSNGHQPSNGEYHYHSSPNALRAQLFDNIQGNPTTGYTEDTSALHHSPILAYAYDGFPIYGPYGYSNPNGTGGIRRMTSGFVIRDGQNGTTNLVTTGRTTLAKWAADLHALAQALPANRFGPNVSAAFSLGRYVEDYDFLGDLGKTQGADFDLDLYNGRFCITPEYPNGTYAYFLGIDASGQPAFPYVLGRQYYGTPSGGNVPTINETVTLYRNAGASSPIKIEVAKSSTGVKLKWTSIEGGNYTVQSSNNGGASYTTHSNNVPSQGLTTSFSISGVLSTYLFRVILN